MVNEIDSETLKTRRDGGEDVLLVDIRTPAETAQGIIPNSILIPMHLLPVKLAELPSNQEVILYCRSGARSYQACAYLAQNGYKNFVNLRGGILAWARHGYDIGS